MIEVIRKEEIENSLINKTRQYLVGNLGRPQKLDHIDSEMIEVGITKYDDFEYEDPHKHKQAYEFQYMISGFTKYLDLDTGETYSFKEGDFYQINPGTKYAQKSKKGTEILFFKIPPGNDKIKIESTDEILEWMHSKLHSDRIDHYKNEAAPKPNSIKPATAAALINPNKEILLVKRRDSGNWTMPGGTLDFGENLRTCVIREVKEETGLDIEITDIIGTYTNPDILVEYSDGEVRQEFTIVYSSKILGGELKTDSESTDISWVSIESLNDLSFAESQKRRLDDVKEYIKTNKVFLR